jgi:hypothetical protein
VTGWQPDGTYQPCPHCRWVPAPDPPFGRPVRHPGTTHHSNCPAVQILTPADRRALTARLIEMDRTRRRGAAQAANYVIGCAP